MCNQKSLHHHNFYLYSNKNFIYHQYNPFRFIKIRNNFRSDILNPTKIDFERDLPRFQSIKFIFQFFGDKADFLFSGELIIHFGVVLVLEWNLLFREINLALFSRFLLHAIFALQILNLPFASLCCLRIFKIIVCTGPEELSIILTVIIFRIASFILFMVLLSLNALIHFLSYLYIFKKYLGKYSFN